MDTVKEGIRRTLAELLAMSGKRNVELAEACGVGKSAVSNWLNGNSSIDIERIPAICDFFGVSMDDFFGRSKAIAAEQQSLTEEEEELLGIYDSLNPEGKRNLLVFARGCAATYPQDNGVRQVESA